MALAATTVWEIRPTIGSDTNGGGFVAGSSGTDYSQQNSANSGGNNSSTTDAVCAGNTTVTSATASFTSAIVGNIIYLNGSWYQVTVFTNSTTISIDRNGPNTTGITMNIGGALAHWVTALAASVSDNIIWIKATGSDVLTTNGVGSASQTDIWVIGYTTSRGDGGQATITTATNSTILFQFSAGAGTRWLLQNLILTNTAGTRANGIKANLAVATQEGLNIINCVFDGFDEAINAANSGFNAGISGLVVLNTEIKNCTSHGAELSQNPTFFMGCFIHDNGGDGIFVSQNDNTPGDNIFERCVFYNNTLNGFRCNQVDNTERTNSRFINCAFVSNTLDGIRLDPSSGFITPTVINSILYGNGGWGINSFQITTPVVSWNNAYGDNTSGATTGWVTDINPVTLTTNPFTNPSGGDFSLNSTSGGGAACKTAGYPSVLP
jgi:hypothetical protein